MKSKILKISALCIVFLTIFSTTGTQHLMSYPVFPDPPPSVTYLAWVSKPSDRTVTTGASVTLTWKAKSSFSSRSYSIYKNNVYVKGGSWSSYVAFSYTYTTSSTGVDTIKCIIRDSIRAYTDYCYVTKNPVPLDSDGDGILNSKEITLGTDPYDKYDPLGQHFENQAVGQNPTGWSTYEYAGYSDVRIVSSTDVSLVNEKPGNLLRITQNEYGAAPCIYDPVSYALSSPKLISFDAAFYDQYDDDFNTAYLDIVSSTAGFILKLEFCHDRVRVWETNTYCRNVNLDFNENQMYKYDVILQNMGSGVDYSIYIDGKLFTYGTVADHDVIGWLEFGVDASYNTYFYIDNIYQGNVDVGKTVNDLHVDQALPLCWVFAPEVAGVRSEYHIGRTTGVEIDLHLKLAGGEGIEAEIGIQLYSWYISINDIDYIIALELGDPDVIMHICYSYVIDKKEIKLPGNSEVYLDVLIDCDYLGSRFEDYSATDFQAAYGWAPSNPTKSTPTKEFVDVDPIGGGSGDVTKLGSHTKTYPQDYGEESEYFIEDSVTYISANGGIDIGKGLFIGVGVSFSDEVFASTWLMVDRALEPQFDYGVPTDGYAFLDIQPYIVRTLGTM